MTGRREGESERERETDREKLYRYKIKTMTSLYMAYVTDCWLLIGNIDLTINTPIPVINPINNS